MTKTYPHSKPGNFQENYDIVIVGSGPTGLTTACLLADFDIRVLLIDKNSTTMNIPRAILLDDEGARTLATAGVGEDALPSSLVSAGAAYINDAGEEFARIGLGSRPFGYPKRNYIYQPELEARLLERAQGRPNLDIRFDTELTGFSQNDEAVSLTLRDKTGNESVVRADWMVACDGGRSFVRLALDVPFRGETYQQDWLVIDTRNDPDRDTFSKFYCHTKRPHVSIPAPRGGRRYEFMLLEGEDRDSIQEPASIEKLLAPFRILAPEDLERKAVYTFNARIAEQWRHGRIFLAGDAAHLTPPFAGQGMNAGFRDAHNLAWKLGLVATGKASPSILESYDRERKEPCWTMIQLAVAMGEFVMPRGAAQIAGRNLLNTLLERFPSARDYILNMKFKPEPRYGDGLFIDIDSQPFDHALVGAMLPQPRVQTADGTATRLDALLGSGFALIAQDDAGEKVLETLGGPLWDSLRPARARLFWDQPPQNDATVTGGQIMTSETDIARPLRTHRDQILLVRPDRYVMGAFFPADAARFGEKLAALLSPGT